MRTVLAGFPGNDATTGRWQTVFESSDVDRARAHVSGLLCDHALDHRFRDTPPLFRHLHAPFASLGVHDLDYTMYGGDASIRVPGLAGLYLLELNLKGSAIFSRGAEETAFHAGQMCVANDGEPHVKRWCTDGRQIIIRIARPRLNQVLEGLIDRPVDAPLRFEPLPRPIDGWTASLAQIVRMIYGELAAPGGGIAQLRAAQSAERLLLELMLETLPHNYTAALEGSLPEPRPGHVRRAIDFMHAHAAEAMTVDDIAQAAGVPVRSLQRAFRDTVGATPMGYLKNLRLDRARQMLLDMPGMGVTRIAFDCGFTHLGKFAAAYRSRFGEAPSTTARR
jgi:AraC-like DNA-binding protein